MFQDRDAKLRQGVDVLDLGVGNPDIRPPQVALDALQAALLDPKVQNHRYPSFNGLPEFRETVAGWYQRRFGVAVNGEREALALLGSKEGIAKFFLAHLNPGDTILLCTPCYPAYLGVAALSQVRTVEVPLRAENDFRPDLAAIPEEDAQRAKVLFINYPNNPSGGTETAELYDEILEFARRHDLFVVSDIAYCDLPLDPSYRARSFLQHDRDRERTIEFHSFSKSYSMQGWRLGFAAGNADIVANLTRIKSNMDFRRVHGHPASRHGRLERAAGLLRGCGEALPRARRGVPVRHRAARLPGEAAARHALPVAAGAAAIP